MTPTPTPTPTSFALYATVAVSFVVLAGVYLYFAAKAWERFERWLAEDLPRPDTTLARPVTRDRAHSSVVPLPRAGDTTHADRPDLRIVR